MIKFFLMLAAIAYWIPPFCLKHTEGFALSRLDSPFPADTAWDTPLSVDTIAAVRQATAQPFHYLGSGGQVFAFVSADGQYVLKCIKNHLRRPHYWALTLPWPEPFQSACRKHLTKKNNKRQRDFKSYHLAFEQLREESGVIYVHLNKTQALKTRLVLIDKLHIAHSIDLDQTEFILQKKAEPLYLYLTEKMQSGREDLAHLALKSTIDLLGYRCQKGIFDEDPKLHANIGILNDKAMFIDMGRFKPDFNRSIYTDLQAITCRLKAWLLENHPALVPHLEAYMEAWHD